MSKIYRRPMFRGGGKVSSYGTGIASGLADGGMPDKRGLVDGPGGYAGEQFGGFVNKVPQAAYDSGRAVTGGSIMRGLGFNLPTFYASLVAGAPAALAYLNRAKTDEGLKYMKSTDPSVFDETAMEGEMEAYSEGFIKANEQGKPISFADNFFLDPETGTYPKFMGRTGDREKLAAIAAAEENIDDFEDYGEAANLEKGERALDAVMRTALERKKRKEDINDLLNNSTNGEIEKDTRSAKEQILENKKLFEEVMGGGKSAMIDDLSTMGLSFAGKALKEGATTKSAFSEFFEEESKRPSRKAKVSDAASNAAIQAYLTGEKSYNDLMKALKVNQAGIDYKMGVESAAKKALTYEELKTLNKQTSTTKKNKTAAQTWLNNQSKEIGQNFLNPISSKDNTEELFVKENVGEYFLDEDSGEFFQIVIIDGAIGKKRIP